MKFHRYLAAAAALLMPTLALASTPLPYWDGEAPATTTAFVFGANPGELIVDASQARALLPISDVVREFDSRAQFLEWAATTLNAVVSADQTEFELSVVEYGTSFVQSDPHVLSFDAVDDPVAMFIGGDKGLVLIDGQQYCVNGDKCDVGSMPGDGMGASFTATSLGAQAAMTPAIGIDIEANASAAVVGGPPDFSIEGYGWQQGCYYRSVGARTTQLTGGFQMWITTCPNGMTCWYYYGHNVLDIYVRYFDATGKLVAFDDWKNSRDTDVIAYRHTGFTFSSERCRSTNPSGIWRYQGTWASHGASDNQHDVRIESCSGTGC